MSFVYYIETYVLYNIEIEKYAGGLLLQLHGVNEKITTFFFINQRAPGIVTLQRMYITVRFSELTLISPLWFVSLIGKRVSRAAGKRTKKLRNPRVSHYTM